MDEEFERRFDAMMRRINDNHEKVLIALRAVQTDMRTVKSQEPALRAYIGARAAETETLVEKLFGRLNDRLDQSERSIEERLRRLEDKEPKP